MNDEKLFARIAPLFDVGLLKDARVLIAGCGSGGSQVALQLAMAGISNFALFDSDMLEPENVIRHACGRRYVGQQKVDALADVLLDRNAAIQVDRYNTDLMIRADLGDHIRQSTVVVLATDNDQTRYRLNQLCVEAKTAFVVGKVFTRGIGGEVFAYRPDEGGCLACLEGMLQRTPYRDGVREIDLVSEEEREKMYGLEIAEIKDSPGLNVDISFITSFHTRYVLDAIARKLPERPKFLLPIDENYVVWGNRPVHPFTKHFQIQRIALQPQDGCLVCGKGVAQ
ncbi:MAG TPA: ThiF family adenylyltransferase [Candidatus Limnocylindrales bacterium]|nr:ThiF family adenylyltransferase [Candidatus Limnocylindrales bacterium]